MTITDSARPTAQPHITVMVPAYNEEKNIASTLQNISSVLQQMSPHWDIVVVDDGSRDQTAQVVQTLIDVYHVTLVRFSRNFGKENAISDLYGCRWPARLRSDVYHAGKVARRL
jgi:glycosyltransferase involved in cell wall biosynthesis